MFSAIARGLAGITGAASRALWSGSMAERMFVIGVIVALIVATGGLGMAALRSVMSLALVVAFLLAIYALVIRGR